MKYLFLALSLQQQVPHLGTCVINRPRTSVPDADAFLIPFSLIFLISLSFSLNVSSWEGEEGGEGRRTTAADDEDEEEAMVEVDGMEGQDVDGLVVGLLLVVNFLPSFPLFPLSPPKGRRRRERSASAHAQERNSRN